MSEKTTHKNVPIPPCIPVGGERSVTYPCWKETYKYRLHLRYAKYVFFFGTVDTFDEFCADTFNIDRAGIEYWLN